MMFDIYNLYVIGGFVSAYLLLMGLVFGCAWIGKKYPRTGGKILPAIVILLMLGMCTSPIADHLRKSDERNQSNDGQP